MKALYILVLLQRFVSVFSTSCTANPSQLQCLAANNRFLLPRKSACDPFKKDCRMGDLIKSSVAGLCVFSFLLFDVCDVTLSVGYPKGRGFDSHRGQANFSACPVWTHAQNNIKNIISNTCLFLTICLKHSHP
jgi:hypothetical protein